LAEDIRTLPQAQRKSLNECLAIGPGLTRILRGCRRRKQIVALLQVLARYRNPEMDCLYNFVLRTVPLDGENIRSLSRLIKRLARLSEGERKWSQRLIYIANNAPPSALAGIIGSHLTCLTTFLKSPRLQAGDIDLIRCLHPYFVNLGADRLESLQAAQEYLNHEYEKVLEQVARVNAMQTALRNHDPKKTAALFEALGVEDHIRLLDIPDHLVDVVDEIDYFEYEICFPLDHVKPLQKRAWGIGEARNLVIRLDLREGL